MSDTFSIVADILILPLIVLQVGLGSIRERLKRTSPVASEAHHFQTAVRIQSARRSPLRRVPAHPRVHPRRGDRDRKPPAHPARKPRTSPLDKPAHVTIRKSRSCRPACTLFTFAEARGPVTEAAAGIVCDQRILPTSRMVLAFRSAEFRPRAPDITQDPCYYIRNTSFLT